MGMERKLAYNPLYLQVGRPPQRIVDCWRGCPGVGWPRISASIGPSARRSPSGRRRRLVRREPSSRNGGAVSASSSLDGRCGAGRSSWLVRGSKLVPPLTSTSSRPIEGAPRSPISAVGRWTWRRSSRTGQLLRGACSLEGCWQGGILRLDAGPDGHLPGQIYSVA
jgi:hypothetical protein